MGGRHSELFTDHDFGNRDPSFSGNRISDVLL
jgi:hypothetical protein